MKRPLDELNRTAEVEIARIRRVVAGANQAEEAFERERNTIENPTPLNLAGRVVLDVGGKKFFTTAAALRAKRGFFRALCDGVGCAKKDSEGSIFIDRSPLAFRFVLNHLRGEPIDLGTMTPLEKEMLAVDAKFYQLDELQALLGVEEMCSEKCVETTSRDLEPNPALTDAVADFWKDLDSHILAWKDDRDQFDVLRRKIESTVSSEKVRLQLMQEDARFATQQQTLTSKGGVLEAKFASQNLWVADLCEDGSIFIDKDGVTFEWVLNLLRGYPLPKSLSRQQTTDVILET